jgi:hypothetical protein
VRIVISELGLGGRGYAKCPEERESVRGGNLFKSDVRFMPVTIGVCNGAD